MPNNILVNGGEVDGTGQSYFEGEVLVFRQNIRSLTTTNDHLILTQQVGIGLINQDVLILRQDVQLRSTFIGGDVLTLRQNVRRLINDQDQIILRQEVE